MSTDRTTEILNYLSAMSREIGEFRTETNRRLDSLETRMTNLETEVRTGFEKVHTELRITNRKFGVFASDMMELRAYQRDLEKRTEVLEKGAGITDTV